MDLTAPGPSGADMMRGAPTMIRNPLGFLHQSWLRHGDVVQFPIPNPPTYLVNHPDAVDRVLRANHKNYGKDTLQYRRLSMLTGFGLLTADTDLWRTQRPVVQPAFGADLAPAVDKATHAACSRIDWPDGVRDVDADILRITLEVVGEVLFGADLTGSAADLAEATLSGLEVVVKKSSPISAPMWMPTPNNRQLATAKARLDRAVGELTAPSPRRRGPCCACCRTAPTADRPRSGRHVPRRRARDRGQRPDVEPVPAGPTTRPTPHRQTCSTRPCGSTRRRG